jgi:hypothetical protein
MIMRRKRKALGRKRLDIFKVLFQYLCGGVKKRKALSYMLWKIFSRVSTEKQYGCAVL